MKRTVLLAAAVSGVRKTLPVTLRLSGLKVTVVKSGLEALREARLRRPEIIILDVLLPDMDGATVADILGRLPSTASIPTVLLRPSSSPTDPYNQTNLLLQVAEVLEMCQAERPAEPTADELEPAFTEVL